MTQSHDAAVDRLEVQVGTLLRAGITLAASALSLGLLSWLVLGGRPWTETLLKAGLVVLMLTPLARVIASVIAYIRLRDWFFVVTTAVVFVVLVAAWLVKS